MKVFITGANGFIGRALKKRCEEYGFLVIECKKDIFDVTVGDIEGANFVFHLAAETDIGTTIKKPEETSRVNVLGTIHLLNTAKEAGIEKFVFASTACVYGRNPVPWDESLPVDPIEPYGWQKVACESALEMWSTRYNLPTVSLRLFQVFGENARANLVFSRFVELCRKKRPLTVTSKKVDGEEHPSMRDFVYVEEVADAFIKAALSKKTGAGEKINVASGEAISLLEIAKQYGSKIKYIPIQEHEVLVHKADTTKAKKLLDWEAKKNVLDWLEGHTSNSHQQP